MRADRLVSLVLLLRRHGRLTATFQDSRHAEWALWQLGTDAEALAPTSLRTSLRDRAAAMAARYADSSPE
ncbi:hypothetical protein GCM10022384_49110 [Streptomyces marokkonensis]|uniref:WCX domain-containing protein n=1 Tax=Streptomyces marokkonensis TaxID=324855 RepID=A0ABP7RDM5_9ACTN